MNPNNTTPGILELKRTGGIGHGPHEHSTCSLSLASGCSVRYKSRVAESIAAPSTVLFSTILMELICEPTKETILAAIKSQPHC